MKAVMISIKPKWVEKIASGKKTIEIRKSAPKLETPFKCYIYMTQGKLKELGGYSQWIYENRMKVIGEFTCDEIKPAYEWTEEDFKATCVSKEEYIEYAGKSRSNQIYGLHISNLKIYDKPKEISEFNGYCEYRGMTNECLRENGEFCSYSYEYITVVHHIKCEKVLTRPPQSWCYVEELGELK